MNPVPDNRKNFFLFELRRREDGKRRRMKDKKKEITYGIYRIVFRNEDDFSGKIEDAALKMIKLLILSSVFLSKLKL